MRISKKPRSATALSYVERVNRAIDHMVSHFHEPLRLADIARVARLSPFHFHRVFQVLIGATPAEFVKRLRLDKALSLMAYTRTRSLTAVAFNSGFSSSSDFSRCFKQRFNVAPRSFDIDAWRKSHGSELESRIDFSERLSRLLSRQNPDRFRVTIRELAARGVAYIRVDKPYQGNAVVKAAERLVRELLSSLVFQKNGIRRLPATLRPQTLSLVGENPVAPDHSSAASAFERLGRA